MQYRIGIDVGGTNTDAVVLRFGGENDSDRGVVSWFKTRTTPEVTDGIALALAQVLKTSGVFAHEIAYISIGTTHFLNAVIETDARRLARVAVLRLGSPYTQQCPPFIDFPVGLRRIVEGHSALLDGGLEISGHEIKPIRKEQILSECEVIRSKKIRNVVVVGVFSPLAQPGTQEEYVKEIIEEALGNVNVVCSKDVGQVGLLERENAAILNASILTFAQRTVRAYEEVLRRLNLGCPLFLTQLDGTLIGAPEASRIPIRTFSNGPTNSMRGASYLAGFGSGTQHTSTLVIDVGGTTTDVGVLLPSGFPRKAAAFTQVGGVRTNFSMPDVYSLGLGGGSRVRFDSESGSARIGPDSVGHNIERDALVFGGQVLTATDLALASGLASDIGDASLAQRRLSRQQCEAGVQTITHILETAIDKMKTDPGDISVLLVGGGSIIVPSALKGVGRIVRPPFFNVANAVGAAIGRVSGEVDRIEIPSGREVAQIIEQCKADAIDNAVRSGAHPSTVAIAEVSVVELPYVSNQASRVVVRAVGDLHVGSSSGESLNFPRVSLTTSSESTDDNVEFEMSSDDASLGMEPEIGIDITTYTPNVSAKGEWNITELDLEWIAEGCAVLGCGGGGATYPALLPARRILRDGGVITVVDHSYFTDSDEWIIPCGYMGSPSVSTERIPAGVEVPTAVKTLMRYCGITRLAAVVSDEIGGKNGIEPMLLASSAGFACPVIDGDLMGRAYPRLNQILPCVYKQQETSSLCPAAGADAIGNTIIIPSARDNITVETVLRAACTELGSSLALAICPIRVEEFRQYAIPRTTSQAWRIGRAIGLCRKSRNITSIPSAIAELQSGMCLFVGKIVDVQSVVRGAFTYGQITIAPLLTDEIEGDDTLQANTFETDDRLIIPFQNENLVADLVKKDGTRKTLCSVPDLIAVLDSQNGSSIGTQDYRYGLRVSVLGLACTPRWTTPEALAVGGPEAFALDIQYQPIGSYCEPRSVIEEFRRR